MQIVVVTTWFPSARNPAAGSFIARDACALATEHDLRVVHLAGVDLDDGARDFTYDGVPVRRIPIDVRSPGGWLAVQRMRGEILEGADLLHTMAGPALLSFIGPRPHIPWVHTEHWSGVAHLAGDGRSRYARPISKRAFAGPDEVVAVSEYLARFVRQLRTGPVSVVGNIVDAVSSAGSEIRKPDSRLRLLAVGAVRPNKGWPIALDTLRVLAQRGVDAELTWLGGGAQLDELRRAADGLPVDAPGHVSSVEVAEAMRAADVLLLPTTAETFSLVTVEALAAGLPVVATGEGAHTEFLAPGTGQVVERTANAVATAALDLKSADREVVLAHGQMLAQRFSEANFLRSYAHVYERVLKQ